MRVWSYNHESSIFFNDVTGLSHLWAHWSELFTQNVTVGNTKDRMIEAHRTNRDGFGFDWAVDIDGSVTCRRARTLIQSNPQNNIIIRTAKRDRWPLAAKACMCFYVGTCRCFTRHKSSDTISRSSSWLPYTSFNPIPPIQYIYVTVTEEM